MMCVGVKTLDNCEGMAPSCLLRSGPGERGDTTWHMTTVCHLWPHDTLHCWPYKVYLIVCPDEQLIRWHIICVVTGTWLVMCLYDNVIMMTQWTVSDQCPPTPEVRCHLDLDLVPWCQWSLPILLLASSCATDDVIQKYFYNLALISKICPLDQQELQMTSLTQITLWSFCRNLLVHTQPPVNSKNWKWRRLCFFVGCKLFFMIMDVYIWLMYDGWLMLPVQCCNQPGQW